MSTTSFCNGQSWSKFDAYYFTEEDDDQYEWEPEENQRGVAQSVIVV